MRISALILVATSVQLFAAPVNATPRGYFVWTKGAARDAGSRAIYRMTLPGMTDVKQLTSTEAVEAQISPDGKWVAYAKAKLPGGSDYHKFNFWRVYVVSIHGVGDGREENLIDENGYWPSWGADGHLYYSQVDDYHTIIMRATLDEYGRLASSTRFFSTRESFPDVPEVNECFMAPDASWFAARVRQTDSPGVGAFAVDPPGHLHLAAAGAKGCMPVVAPSGTWALIAGSTYGLRWGESPLIENRQVDQVLVEARGANGHVYHPGISSDEQWVMAGHSTELDHNEGAYSLYLYELNNMQVSNEQLLVDGGFNGWPALWVGEPGPPPPPVPFIDSFYPSSYTVLPGEQVDLIWETSFTDLVRLDNVAVSEDGETSVQPATTTDFILVAANTQNLGVTHTEECTVTVNAVAVAVTIDQFTIEPADIIAGERATLTWAASSPSTLDIDGVRVAPAGTMSVDPLTTTTYTLTVRGHEGPKSASVTLAVGQLEEIQDALLPDRGGCVCSASAARGTSDVWLSLLFLCVFGRARSRRRV